MSIYTKLAGSNTAVNQTEVDLYGSSRVGMTTQHLAPDSAINMIGGFVSGTRIIFTRGEKLFELSNHLGNVLVTVSDRRVQVDGNSDGTVDSYKADITNANDYYPFGMLMPSRRYSAAIIYRYGFQRQENDNEVKGEGNFANFKYRVYDPRLGRFVSVDPLTPKFAYNSPYAFSENRVLDGVELEGKEVLLIGKQESGGVFVSGSAETGIVIAPNGVYAYGSGSLGISTSVSVATQISVTFFPTMPIAQKAGGWSGSGGGSVSGVLWTGSLNAVYCSGYLGINVTGGIGGSYGALGNFTADVNGSYTRIKPLSELAKKEDAIELLKKGKEVLTNNIASDQSEINSLKLKNDELSKSIEILQKIDKNLMGEGNRDKQKVEMDIQNTNSEIFSNLAKTTELEDNIKTMNTGLSQVNKAIDDVNRNKEKK